MPGEDILVDGFEFHRQRIKVFKQRIESRPSFARQNLFIRSLHVSSEGTDTTDAFGSDNPQLTEKPSRRTHGGRPLPHKERAHTV